MKDSTHGLIQEVCQLSVLVSFLVLEIQVTREWTVHLDPYGWRLSQGISVLWIEEKISDACLPILIFSCVRLHNSDAGFIAILKSCRIMLNDVHCGFTDLKKLSYWFRRETPHSWVWLTFRGSNWNFCMMTYEIFQPLPSSLFISLAKLVFNSISYSKLVSEAHYICHCWAKKLSFHQQTVLSQVTLCFTRKNLLPTRFCFYCLISAFLPVFNP